MMTECPNASITDILTDRLPLVVRGIDPYFANRDDYIVTGIDCYSDPDFIFVKFRLKNQGNRECVWHFKVSPNI
jgi:hypothetical protein